MRLSDCSDSKLNSFMSGKDKMMMILIEVILTICLRKTHIYNNPNQSFYIQFNFMVII